MMSRIHPAYVVALAILIVGLAFAGVQASTLLFGLLALACPLMMMFMMGGHGGGHSGSNEHDQHQYPSNRER